MTGKPKREKRLEVRFNEEEYNALKSYAESHRLSLAEAIRLWVRTLMED